MCQVSLAFNGLQLISFNVKRTSLVFPRFKIDCIQTGPTNQAESLCRKIAIHIASKNSIMPDASQKDTKKLCLDGFMCNNPKRQVSTVLNKLNQEFYYLMEKIMKNTKKALSTNRGFLLLPLDLNLLLCQSVERLPFVVLMILNTELLNL